MANQLYNFFKQQLCSGAIDLYNDTLKIMLVSGSYSFSQSHKFTGDISSEISSSNYTKGGKEVTNTSVYLNSITNEVFLSGTNVSFSGITSVVNFAVLYRSGATNDTSYLIAQVDIGSNTVNNATLNINWNADGIVGLL